MPITTQSVFTSEDLLRNVGCSYRMLDYWCRQGILNESAAGSGSTRRFSDLDVRVASAVAQLTRLGCRGAVLRSIAATLYERLESWAGRGYLIARYDGSAEVSESFALTSEPVWIVPVGVDEADAA